MDDARFSLIDDGNAPAGRRTRTYTEAEKLALMARALETSPYVVQRETQVPARTIYSWFDEAGGLAQVRAFSEQQAAAALAESRAAVCNEAMRRLGRISDSELMMTYRNVNEGSSGGEAASQAGAAAQANAQVLQVIVQGEDGPETIEVPRE